MKDLLRENDPTGEHAPSYYAATAGEAPRATVLDGDVDCDICIIGAGFAGLSAAVHLMGKGLSVRVVDANRAGWGASGRNGGQLGSGQRLGQRAIEKMVGLETAKTFWALAEEAKATVRGLAASHDIACDLKPGQLHAGLGAVAPAEMRAEADHLRDVYGYDQLDYLEGDALRAALDSPLYTAGIMDHGAGHLHPLNFALGLGLTAVAGGVILHEDTRVSRVAPGSPNRVETPRGIIRAGKVLFATNGYHGGLEPHNAARVMPINNFIIATEPLGEDRARSLIRDDACVADTKFVVNYFRFSADHRMLFGGGETYSYTFPRDIPALVRPNMLEVFPQLADAKIDYSWGGTLGITLSRLPCFHAPSPTQLSVGGFSGHGVPTATFAGRLMAAAALDDRDGFDTFAGLTSRPFPGGQAARHPLLVLAMTWYALRDRLGI